MSKSEKDRLAAEVQDQWVFFQLALGENKRKYPTQEFRSFAESVRRYVDLIGKDALIHRDVVRAIHGLDAYLRVERKRVPDEILHEAARLECLLFAGYDPHFDGDEPPGH